MRGLPIVLLMLPFMTACESGGSIDSSASLTDDQRAAVEDSVRALIARGDRAYMEGRPADHRATYADSGVVLSAGGEVSASTDTVNAILEHIADTTGAQFSVAIERGPMHIAVLGPEAAVVSGNYVATLTHKTTGEKHSYTYARTSAVARRDGRWVVVHEHESWPEQGADAVPADSTHQH